MEKARVVVYSSHAIVDIIIYNIAPGELSIHAKNSIHDYENFPSGPFSQSRSHVVFKTGMNTFTLNTAVV